MGLAIGFSNSSYEKVNVIKNVNPDPKRCYIKKHLKIGIFLILYIRYIDSINFEGNKLLVYNNCILEDLEKQLLTVGVDPHFSNTKEFYSPIARFIPTDEGIKMAISFCNNYVE